MKYNSAPVVLNGVYYSSMREAARKLHTNYSAIYFGVAGKPPPHKRNHKPGWRYATPEEIERHS